MNISKEMKRLTYCLRQKFWQIDELKKSGAKIMQPILEWPIFFRLTNYKRQFLNRFRYTYRKWLFIFLFFSQISMMQALAPENLLSFAVGAFDFTRPKHRTWEFAVEYKFLLKCFSSPWQFLEFRPLVGIMATATESVYLYGGLNFDLLFWDHLLIAPGFAAGYYARGDGKNLGYPLEFRSGLELGYQCSDGHRFGLHFYHLSNASLGHRNPGEESLVFYYDIPIKCGFPFIK